MSTRKVLLKGTPASLGSVSGIVRIVSDPNDSDFNQGDILVTEMTNPRYLPLISKAAAIVTDIGGQLCHAAITARKLKIPCIVATSVATTTLKDGQKIFIDAEKGEVYAIE